MQLTPATLACIVRENIQLGYGVDDIHVLYRAKYDITADDVRAEVRNMREDGSLFYMFTDGIEKAPGD